MKVAVVTILDNINLGTIFQAYALADRIQEIGCDVEFINYTRSLESPRYQIRTIISYSGNPIKKLTIHKKSFLSNNY